MEWDKYDTIKGAPLKPRVTAFITNDNCRLLLTFNNREKRMLDVHQLLGMTVFLTLIISDIR